MTVIILYTLMDNRSNSKEIHQKPTQGYRSSLRTAPKSDSSCSSKFTAGSSPRPALLPHRLPKTKINSNSLVGCIGLRLRPTTPIYTVDETNTRIRELTRFSRYACDSLPVHNFPSPFAPHRSRFR